jgi:hypothetical protein
LHDKVAIAEVVGIWAGINILTTAMSKFGENVTPYIIKGLSECFKLLPFAYTKVKLLRRG